jgi:hypothetical protein
LKVVRKRQGDIMEWKLSEHWFAYFLFLVLFIIAGALFRLSLDVLEIRGTPGFLVFFFLTPIIFAPIAKYWHGKFLNKDRDG